MNELYQELENAYDRWEKLYTHGGSDPFWPDGVNLNLVRNHISYYKNQILEIQGAEQREVLLRPLPEKVADGYMADADGIRQRAGERMEQMEVDKNCRFIREHIGRMKPSDVEKLSLNYAADMPKALRDAIQSDDLVSMRRMTNSPFDAKYFADKAEEIRNLKPEENEQLSLFYDSSFEEDESQSWDFQMGGM